MTAYEMLFGECPFDTESSEYAIMGRIAESKITLPKSPEFPELDGPAGHVPINRVTMEWAGLFKGAD